MIDQAGASRLTAITQTRRANLAEISQFVRFVSAGSRYAPTPALT